MVHYIASAGVEVRPMIIIPLSNIISEEHKTVILNCVVMATTIFNWTSFSWLKDGDTIVTNPNKYRNSAEINSYKSSINVTLTISNVSIEDRGNYTLIVYYDSKALKKYGITGEFVNQTTGSLQVDTDNEG